jgi:hypothetical protein
LEKELKFLGMVLILVVIKNIYGLKELLLSYVIGMVI